MASPELLSGVVRQLAHARRLGATLAVVVGGGNIVRGRDYGNPESGTQGSSSSTGLTRVAADRAGMIATVINGIRLSKTLPVPATHLCAFGIPGMVEHYTVERAQAELAAGRIVVLSGGTGNPYFSTDSAAALRAAELGVELLMKATNVAGVYSADPRQTKNARLYRRLSYEQTLAARLAVMDLPAFALCMECRIPIRVFDLSRPRAIIEIIQGKEIGSYIC